MNALALSLTPSTSSDQTFLIKGLFYRGKEFLGEQMKTNRDRGGANLYAHSEIKIAWFFKQQKSEAW